MFSNPQEEFISLFQNNKKQILHFRDLFYSGSFFLGNNKNVNTITNIYSGSKPIPEDVLGVEVKDNYFLCKENITGAKILLDGPDYTYRLNKDGFRSKDFLEFNKNQTNVLFAGCSITFGQGLPEELVWPQMVMNKLSCINPEKDFASYNVGIPGIGIFAICKNILAFIESVGKPDKIFVLFPNISRGFVYSDERSDFLHSDMFIDKKMNDHDYKYMDSYRHMEQIFLVTSIINYLESICKSLNIDLMWSTWEDDSDIFFNELYFKNFVRMKQKIWDKHVWPPDPDGNEHFASAEFKEYSAKRKKELEKKNKNSLPYWSSARDGHPGAYFMQTVAENFLKEIKK